VEGLCAMQYRQGDVLVVVTQAVPAEAVSVPRSEGELVLAEGEATGHRHAIADPHAELLAVPGEEIERRFLRIVGETATLTHQEHDPILLPPGLYEVIRQREYVPVPKSEPQTSRRRWFRLVQD
jgi:hypothetical protein